MNYFAYGSNMDIDRMRKRGVSFSKRIFASLPGYRLEFNKVAQNNPRNGYANIVPDDSNSVEGILYEIDNSSISILNRYEGCPGHYLKIEINVLVPNKRIVSAITYIANSNKVRDGLKPTKEYLKHLLAGKDLLSKDYYKRLQNTETLD